MHKEGAHYGGEEEREISPAHPGLWQRWGGRGRLEGQAVFVKGALRGELCQVHLLNVGKTAAWGKVDQVLEPSPGRQVPTAPGTPSAGGASCGT